MQLKFNNSKTPNLFKISDLKISELKTNLASTTRALVSLVLEPEILKNLSF